MTREQFISSVEGTQKAFRRFLVALCCGDAQLADDIAQESYIKAYLACDDICDASKFRAWIFRIGYNTFLNHKRSQKVTVDYEDAVVMHSDIKTDAAFKYQELYAALRSLPEKERMSILLFYIEGYAIKEISEIVGASQDAVKQHLSRGRNHLRGLLSNKK
jgi:RNA polymerase sigma-70 factor (ECF subfamily)